MAEKKRELYFSLTKEGCPDKADRRTAPSAHLKDLLQLLVVLHHDDVGLAVLCYILTGFWGVGGVDAHSEPTATRGTGRESNCSPPTELIRSSVPLATETDYAASDRDRPDRLMAV